MENIGSALTITVIGMGVIFVVLSLLLVTIIALNKVFPHKAPPPPAGEGVDEDTEVVAVIQAAIAAYLRRRPEEISIKSIK